MEAALICKRHLRLEISRIDRDRSAVDVYGCHRYVLYPTRLDWRCALRGSALLSHRTSQLCESHPFLFTHNRSALKEPRHQLVRQRQVGDCLSLELRYALQRPDRDRARDARPIASEFLDY